MSASIMFEFEAQAIRSAGFRDGFAMGLLAALFILGVAWALIRVGTAR